MRSRSRSTTTGTWSDGFSQLAHMLVDRRRDQPVGGLRRQQEMVDADAVVLLPGAGLVIPERVEAGLVAGARNASVRPRLHERAELSPGLRQEQRVADPGGRVAGIGRRRNDVVVAGQDQRLLQRQTLTRIVNKPVHPFDLVGIFFGVRRVSVGQIDRRDADRAGLGGDRCFEETGVVVLVVAGQPGRDLVERQF